MTDSFEAAPIIQIGGLTVKRGTKPVLTDVDLIIRRGIATGLVGPSGAGKTTLMRAIVGVQTVQAGHVTVLGQDAGGAELRRRVGYVTQAPSVYGDLTVAENLAYFARIVDVPKRRVEDVIGLVALAAERDQVVGTLSGGERSRCSLAAALLGSPEVLVLDEPTVGLDPGLRRDLWTLFHRLVDDGASIVISTHVMDEAARCDELVLMRDGRVMAASTTPRDLLQRTHTADLDAAFLALVASA
jgi:ABC-2 type transport system ATP-binding protein